MRSFNGWSKSRGLQSAIEQINDSLDVGAFVTFDTEANEPVMLKVGLSLVDGDGARRNLETELGPFGWDFDAVAMKSRNEWNDLLSKIEVKGGTEEDKEKFYTNLYRCYCQKQTWSDADGRYRDPMERIQQLPSGWVMYGGDAFWNTFWNLNTLWSLITPDIMNNWVRTQIELYDKTGWTNNGPTGLEHTGVMEVSHEVALMTSAYMKGIRDYDTDKLYKAIRNTARVQGSRQPMSGLAGMDNLDIYNKLGYVPYNVSRTDRTLNYAYTDYCFAQLAKAHGQDEDYRFHLKRSANWKNLFNPGVKYIVPRNSEGAWLADFHPLSGFTFTEGNSWQYTWYVPHDVPGLVSLLGIELFNSRLEEGFEKSVKFNFAAHAFDRSQKTIYEYYVNHGNESNMQAAFLFNYSGKPWLTQKYTRAILEKYYGNTPYHGWEGDEDEGQMGGWFVIASMGLFEMDGGVTADPVFDLTSPLFDEIIILIDEMYYGGKPLVIKTINNSAENVYIQSATFNGSPLTVPKLKFKDVVKGGELVFFMGNNPNTIWGSNDK